LPFGAVKVLSAIPKFFESLIVLELHRHLNSFLIDEQHGFRPRISTSTNLLVFQSFLLNAVECSNQDDVIYTDLRKVFDTNYTGNIDTLILFKLSNYGLSWLSAYLHQRTPNVNIHGYCSVPIYVASGVPQEGHLSPLLFNI